MASEQNSAAPTWPSMALSWLKTRGRRIFAPVLSLFVYVPYSIFTLFYYSTMLALEESDSEDEQSSVTSDDESEPNQSTKNAEDGTTSCFAPPGDENKLDHSFGTFHKVPMKWLDQPKPVIPKQHSGFAKVPMKWLPPEEPKADQPSRPKENLEPFVKVPCKWLDQPKPVTPKRHSAFANVPMKWLPPEEMQNEKPKQEEKFETFAKVPCKWLDQPKLDTPKHHSAFASVPMKWLPPEQPKAEKPSSSPEEKLEPFIRVPFKWLPPEKQQQQQKPKRHSAFATVPMKWLDPEKSKAEEPRRHSTFATAPQKWLPPVNHAQLDQRDDALHQHHSDFDSQKDQAHHDDITEIRHIQAERFGNSTTDLKLQGHQSDPSCVMSVHVPLH